MGGSCGGRPGGDGASSTTVTSSADTIKFNEEAQGKLFTMIEKYNSQCVSTSGAANNFRASKQSSYSRVSHASETSNPKILLLKSNKLGPGGPPGPLSWNCPKCFTDSVDGAVLCARAGCGYPRADWTCPHCNNLNYEGRFLCNRVSCRAP